MRPSLGGIFLTHAKRLNVPYPPHTKATFGAVVDAFIPSTPELASILGTQQWFGAADLGIDEYMIWEIDHTIAIYMGLGMINIPLSSPTAAMLDAAAAQLIASGEAQFGVNPSSFPGGGAFAALAPSDRFLAISLLKQLDVDLGSLPYPYTNNAENVLFMMTVINQSPVFGYYSEWAGYGTSRLNSPDNRILEFFPPSWSQIGYPGPAYGYRGLRGFVLDISQVRRFRYDL